MTINTRVPRTLSESDKVRLEKIAPLFDIQFNRTDDGSYSLSVDEQSPVRLPTKFAHLRLLTELCSKTVSWIYFHQEESCADSFLNQTDERLKRLSVLYRKKKASDDTGLESDALMAA